MRFLLECLSDLNSQLTSFGGRLYVWKGDPSQVLRTIKDDVGLDWLSFDEVRTINSSIHIKLKSLIIDIYNIF